MEQAPPTWTAERIGGEWGPTGGVSRAGLDGAAGAFKVG
jgi:hypothetical protein